MKSLLSLAVPLLLNIFQYLSINDKKNVILCCSYLRRILSHPLHWSGAVIKKNILKSEINLPRLLSISRYSLVRELDLSDLKYQFIDKTVANQFLKYLQNNTSLRILNFNNNNLSKFPAFPLSSCLVRCERLSLSSTKLQTDQLNSILGKCCRGKYVLSADLSFNDFTFVNPSLLTDSILTLRELNLSYTNLTAALAKKLTLAVNNSSIRHLDISGNDLTECNFDNISLNQSLTSLNLSQVKLNPETLDRVFTNLTLVHNLEELFLDGTALGHVDPILLSDAIVRVSKVDVNFCWLYQQHIEFIFDSISEKTKVKYLNLSGNHMENVNIDLLLDALNHLDVVKIEWANLSEDQFELIIRESTDLKRKKIVLNHFELIDNNVELHRLAKCNQNIMLNLNKD